MNSGESLVPASIRMACSSVEGASTLSEARVVGLYQYIYCVLLLPERDDVFNVPCATSTETGVFLELRHNGVLGSTHGPGPMLILPRDALWALLERALRREATAAAGSNTFREQMLTSRQMPCPQAEAAGRGVPKRSLTGRCRAPGAPTPQQDDPGRCEAQLHPLGALPAFVPAGVVADLWVEPDAGAFWLEHPFVGGEVLRVVQRRAASAAVDGVARAERLHRGRACSEGAGDPLVAPVLVDPTADVVYELPERNPLIYSHAPSPLFNCTSLLAYI